MSVIGGILAVGKGVDLLWTNASPTSTFAAQVVPIDLSGYAYCIISFHNFATSSGWYGVVAQECVIGEKNILQFVSPTNNRAGNRAATVSTSGISFSACTYNDDTNNGYCIPYKIFGVQGRIGSGGGIAPADIYTGPYTVTPEAFNSQTLSTRNKLMIDDVTVEEIPYREEDNASGGKTVYIGMPEEPESE